MKALFELIPQLGKEVLKSEVMPLALSKVGPRGTGWGQHGTTAGCQQGMEPSKACTAFGPGINSSLSTWARALICASPCM